MIRDLSVVENARTRGLGPWSAGTLLTRLSPVAMSAAGFAEDWLKTWDMTSLNGLPIEARSTERLVKHWPRDGQGKLDLMKAPFRLMAIAYRPDIEQGRLLYSLYDTSNFRPIELTLIFEFALPGQQADWAKDFRALGELPFGEAYNARLAALTDRFARKENLLQIRTNDFELEIIWEFRQFKLGAGGRLELRPLTHTPHDSYFEGPASNELIEWLRVNGERFVAGKIELPTKMLGATSSIPKDSFRWLEGRELPEEIRAGFAMHTCNGCHGGETFTQFTHVLPRNVSAESEISEWLKQDMPHRVTALQKLLESR